MVIKAAKEVTLASVECADFSGGQGNILHHT